MAGLHPVVPSATRITRSRLDNAVAALEGKSDLMESELDALQADVDHLIEMLTVVCCNPQFKGASPNGPDDPNRSTNCPNENGAKK